MDRLDEVLSRRAREPGPVARSRGGSRLVPGLLAGKEYNFASGGPDPASFPTKEIAEVTARVMAEEGQQALAYGSWDGFQGMRDWVQHRLRFLEGLEVDTHNIMITNGSGDALGLAFQTFIDWGDPILMETPCFVGGLQILLRNGADIHGIEVDNEGMRTDQLADRLESLTRAGRRPKLIYVIPNFQNPTGVTLSERRRLEILDLARKYNVPVMEDDAYGEMRIDGTPVKSLWELDGGQRVIRTGTISKTLGAGTRIGWVIAPDDIAGYIAGFNFAGSVSPFTSRIAAAYMHEHFETHLADLRRIYRSKRDAMLEALEEGLAERDAEWTHPEGGFFVWLRLPPGTSQSKLAQLASERGIGYMPGPGFMLNGGGENYIRLAYSIPSPEAIRAGTRLLCEAIVLARE
jgi:2-aminoadipate transaminase